MITIKEVDLKNDLKDFINFPYQLYKNNPYYVYSLIDDNALFSQTKNISFDYCECRMFLCVEGDKVLGRIATIINHRYNEEHNVKELRFFRYDVVNNLEVSTVLLNQVKKIAVENGMTSIVGEMGFTQFSHYGLLTDGFEEYSSYSSRFNYPYVIEHLKKLNFKEDESWATYRITLPEEVDKRMEEMSKFILKKNELKLIPITTLKKSDDLTDLICKSISLRLKSFDYLYGFNSISEDEIASIVYKFRMIVQVSKNFVNTTYYYVIVDKNEDIVGFTLCIPSIAKLLSKQKVKIMPTLAYIYNKANSKGDSIDLISFIVKKEYQNTGVSLVLRNELYKACKNNNIKYINTDFDFDLSRIAKEEFKDEKIEKVKTFTTFRFDLIS